MQSATKSLLSQHVFDGFQQFGITPGDTVLIRANLGSIGRFKKDDFTHFIDYILDFLGPDGTLVGLTFTSFFNSQSLDPNVVFDINTPTNAGKFSELLLEHPKSIRSFHPTCSFAAIGKQASDILKNHSINSSLYQPMDELIQRKAKMLLIGCSDQSPGFTTVHHTLSVLGHSQKTLPFNKCGVYYLDDQNQKKRYIQKENGGCSRGFGKLYTDYIAHNKLQIGYIGKAYTLCINAHDAFTIERDILKDNPRYSLCDHSDCHWCRATWSFNKRDLIPFMFRRKS